MRPTASVPVTLEECEELAPELGARDGLDLACRFASLTLPGVFRRDDPVLDLPIAINDQVELRKLLAALPSEAFRADDALGWTYQFWQAQRKDEVNESGKKIGADELSPVTQLFTEDYMVEFLLHNTLGAWWAGKIGPIKAATEEEARAQAALPARDGVPAISWTYLRFVQDETTKTWLPAAGTFDGWPKSASLIRLLDPCMGSGHFLVFALPLLVRLRMEEEKLSAQAAVVAVLKDNIYGLELDERCTQIAAFNVALTAWKLAGYQALPSLQLGLLWSCAQRNGSGVGSACRNNDRARSGMARLHTLQRRPGPWQPHQPPRPGRESLLRPSSTNSPRCSPLRLRTKENDDIELALLLRVGYQRSCSRDNSHLSSPTCPTLDVASRTTLLKDYCERIHPEAKSDLATCFVERCLALAGQWLEYCSRVTPQSWLFMEPTRSSGISFFPRCNGI